MYLDQLNFNIHFFLQNSERIRGGGIVELSSCWGNLVELCKSIQIPLSPNIHFLLNMNKSTAESTVGCTKLMTFYKGPVPQLQVFSIFSLIFLIFYIASRAKNFYTIFFDPLAMQKVKNAEVAWKIVPRAPHAGALLK